MEKKGASIENWEKDGGGGVFHPPPLSQPHYLCARWFPCDFYKDPWPILHFLFCTVTEGLLEALEDQFQWSLKGVYVTGALACTAKNQYRKFETNIPSHSPNSLFMCLWAIDRSA